MGKYRKRPVVVEAVQWFKPGDVESVISMEAPHPLQVVRNCRHCDKPMPEHGRIKTLEGWHIVCPSDWIITGVKNERYPVKDNIFKETYEAVVNV